MELEIVRADPAGNITLFVLNPPASRGGQAEAARALLAAPGLAAEQVGFVFPPGHPGALWRLAMMGGEFCGNAARSFGLLAARRMGLSGRHTLSVAVSGAAAPVPVSIDTHAHTAEAVIPAPVQETSIEHQGQRFPVYLFEGISHIIAETGAGSRDLARSLIDALLTQGEAAARRSDAVGVLFYDSARQFVEPAVWVRATGSLVFESSCGSGSAALGVWAARHSARTDETHAIAQRGGVITVRVVKQGGNISRLSIGGTARLGEPFVYKLGRVPPLL
jgi:diaminopimelate epimerase